VGPARRVSACAVVLGLAFAASGCGGGGSKHADPAADLALAKSAVLTPQDLPGFAAAPRPKGKDVPAQAKRDFARCLKTDVTFVDHAPTAQEADSLNFTRLQAQVFSRVSIEPSAADIDAHWKVDTEAGIERCLEALYRTALKPKTPNSITVGLARVARFDVGIGDRSVGFTVSVPVTVNKIDPDVYVDLLLIARGRAGVEIEAEDVGTPFDRRTELDLARRVYDRIGTKADT
jgi:hypothetical protein